MPESEYSAFLQYKEMKDKHDYLQNFGVDTDEDIAKTLAMFGGFTEGLQLFASFAMLMNFPRFNKMKGMGQIVSWSVRDESLHCEGIIRLFHAFTKERNCLTKSVKEEIIDACQKTVRLEDAFIDLAFEMGPVEGMYASDSASDGRCAAACSFAGAAGFRSAEQAASAAEAKRIASMLFIMFPIVASAGSSILRKCCPTAADLWPRLRMPPQALHGNHGRERCGEIWHYARRAG